MSGFSAGAGGRVLGRNIGIPDNVHMGIFFFSLVGDGGGGGGGCVCAR